MPCQSSHCESTREEVVASQMFCILDELDGKEFVKSHWSGYHPLAYGKEVDLHSLASKVCSRLQQQDVSRLSLEAQMWWRDHQAADRRRIELALQEHKAKKDRKAALGKLTPYERRLLGLCDIG